ncbi:MAG: UDP-N-acetylmuramate--L-alanine ligase [Candidatus Cloacimonadota bacterium]|nr:MAG: UDP-N-acetylmuramate--L-alanine ligase [Candidatus Cloacimonadota bacterium]
MGIDNSKKIHFIGIGGTGMSGLAHMCLKDGFCVSGSDLRSSKATNRLSDSGAIINFPHNKGNISDEPVIVISSAIPESNEELKFAKSLGLTIKKRAEMLAWFMKDKSGISIAGCHGKTTTTTMVSSILTQAGVDPSTIVGGEANHVGGNAKYGKGEYIVAEADESDGSFLLLPSKYSIVTNVDNDHLDYYKNFEGVCRAFFQFIQNTRDFSIVCGESEALYEMVQNQEHVKTYGLSDKFDYWAEDIKLKGFSSEFTVKSKTGKIIKLLLNTPGLHNLLNGVAAVAMCDNLGIAQKDIELGLAKFCGVQRRFEKVQDANEILVVDDYAHHPTEIKATMKSASSLAKSRNGKLIVVFQPHRYSRVAEVLEDYKGCFEGADFLYMAPIYSSGELNPLNLSTWDIYKRCDYDPKNIMVLDSDDWSAFGKKLAGELKANDVLLTLGAGDITYLGRLLDLTK